VLTAASRRLGTRPGFAFERRTIPPSLIRRLDGVRVTSRALTVLDLIPETGAPAIDAALRRKIPLAHLRAALQLTAGRPVTGSAGCAWPWRLTVGSTTSRGTLG